MIASKASAARCIVACTSRGAVQEVAKQVNEHVKKAGRRQNTVDTSVKCFLYVDLSALNVRDAMEEVAKQVNGHAQAAGQPQKSVDEVAMGFIRVANETMCRPIRALTQMRVRPLLHLQLGARRHLRRREVPLSSCAARAVSSEQMMAFENTGAAALLTWSHVDRLGYMHCPACSAADFSIPEWRLQCRTSREHDNASTCI